MSTAAILTVAYVATEAASGVAETMNNYGEAKRAERVDKYNARVTEEKIKSLNYEEAMNMTLRRLNAYSDIASAKNTMAGRGNIGTSADAATMNAYMNLAGDLSAMSFNYENQRNDLEQTRRNYLYQAKIAKAQKKSAIMGGILKTSGKALAGVAHGYSSGVFGSSSNANVS